MRHAQALAAAMSHPVVAIWLASGVALVGCGDLGGPSKQVATVTVVLPAGILLGDTVQAKAIATDASGRTVNKPATWRSSNPAAISVDTLGRVIGKMLVGQATIFADVENKEGSATVSVADDQRFGYALADQPSATGPYSPDAAYRYTSSGGPISVTRDSIGTYSVRFAGLGRAPGQRDNVQVTGYGGAAAYCKPRGWDATAPDLVVEVRCWSAPDAVLADSRFTILVVGARAFGPSTPVGFALSFADTGAVLLDTSATARNSTSGDVVVGRTGVGNFAVAFLGLGQASAGGPVAIQIVPVGRGPRRCDVAAVDPAASGIWVQCVVQNQTSTVDYSPDPRFSLNSSGGSITARKTAAGKHQVVFGGLARPAGATETVQISPYLGGETDHFCTIISWGNTGANDLTVTLACFDPTGTLADGRFDLLVVQDSRGLSSSLPPNIRPL
jgi:hypothetical protein